MSKASKPDLQSPLGRVRGHGSAKEGVHHWWLQRVTAIALIPLTVWFLAKILVVAQHPDPFRLVDWLASPYQVFLLLALIIALFWHAKLGLQVVIEDYVHAKCCKYTLLLLNNFFCWGAGILAALAVLRLHLLNIVTGL